MNIYFKYQCFLCFLFLGTSVFSQKTIFVKIENADSGKNLTFANVFLKNNNKGNGTDLEGLSVIDLGKDYVKKDSLICSYIGFESIAILVDLKESDTFFVKMSPVYIHLNSVEVLAKLDKRPASELMKNALKNIKNNYVEKETNFDAFYEETVFENGGLMAKYEALCEFHYTKYPQKNYARKSWKIFWDNEFLEKYPLQEKYEKSIFISQPQFFKYYNTVDDQCKIITTRKTKGRGEEGRKPIISGGPLAISAADKVKYLSDFLDPALQNVYQFDRDGAIMIDSQLCLVIRFKPKKVQKKVHQEWNKKVESPLFSGSVYLSEKDFAVVKFECQFAKNARMESYQIFEPWGIFPTTLNVTANYQQNEQGKWFLKSVTTKQFLKGNSSIKWKFENDFECVRSLFVLNVKEKNVEHFDEDHPNLLKDKHLFNLYDFPIPYKKELWDEFEKEFEGN